MEVANLVADWRREAELRFDAADYASEQGDDAAHDRISSRARALRQCAEQLEAALQANAHLIAAAPDLLAALIALDERGHTDATWMLAKRAIAKATGGAK